MPSEINNGWQIKSAIVHIDYAHCRLDAQHE